MAGPHTQGMMPALVEWLQAEGIEYEVHEHRPSFTATGTAHVEGVDPHSFAKVVWVRTDEGGDALMVLDAMDHLDLKKAARALNSSHVKLIPEAELEHAAPGCAVGAMPAVGRLFDVPTFADHAVAKEAEISFNGGSHEVSVRVDRNAWERSTGVTYRDLAAHPWREPAWVRS